MAGTVDRLEMTRLFVRIVETGSLSGAARATGMSQPSVSRQLRQLETLLGVALVLRSTHELTLTDAGRRFLAEGRALIAAWERLGEELRGTEASLVGSVRVLAPAGLGQTVLADIAAAFVAAHPEVTLDWLTDDAPRDLTAEGIDLWLRIGPVRDEGLIVRELARMPRVLVARADVPVVEAPACLEDRRAVLLSPYMGDEIAIANAAGQRQTLRPPVAARTENLFAAERLVRGGIGWSALPEWLVAPGIADGTLRVLCPGWRPATLPLVLAYQRARFRPARVTAFAEAMARGVAERLS